MGLCKCPKKKVTNLFCFEHRVNVCEHCLVENHPKCIVQSYLHWLQDSDYNPVCLICNENLVSQELGECIRLVCYDVFHWNCLNAYGSRMPPNTAPAGFECPSCSKPIIPPINAAGPVADSLKKKLKEAPWARPGLGLPQMSGGDSSQIPVPEMSPPNNHMASDSFYSNKAVPQMSAPPLRSATPPARPAYPHNALEMNGPRSDLESTTRNLLDVSPKPFQSRSQGSNNLQRLVDEPPRTFDSDDYKYRRRPLLNWLGQWLRNILSSAGPQRRQTSVYRRFIIVIILGVIGLLTVIVVLLRVGRSSADKDPMLDPRLNPQIRVEQAGFADNKM